MSTEQNETGPTCAVCLRERPWDRVVFKPGAGRYVCVDADMDACTEAMNEALNRMLRPPHPDRGSE